MLLKILRIRRCVPHTPEPIFAYSDTSTFGISLKGRRWATSRRELPGDVRIVR